MVRNDTTPYGSELAKSVADCLVQKQYVGYMHRYYCGMALWYRDGKFIYGKSEEGAWNDADDELRIFDDRDSFVAWLAAQSDESMYGTHQSKFFRGNQRLNRQRLEEYHTQRTR